MPCLATRRIRLQPGTSPNLYSSLIPSSLPFHNSTILSAAHLTKSSYTTPLAYPHPDSFPQIFTANSATIDTLLSTDPRISTSAAALRKQVLQFLRGDEREGVGNALAEIGEEYHDGWESEESDDD